MVSFQNRLRHLLSGRFSIKTAMTKKVGEPSGLMLNFCLVEIFSPSMVDQTQPPTGQRDKPAFTTGISLIAAILLIIAISSLTHAITPASAAPLSKETCKSLKAELRVLQQTEAIKNMSKGFEWVKENMQEEERLPIKQFLSVTEQLQFQCRPPRAAPKAKKPKTVRIDLPIKKPPEVEKKSKLKENAKQPATSAALRGQQTQEQAAKPPEETKKEQIAAPEKQQDPSVTPDAPAQKTKAKPKPKPRKYKKARAKPKKVIEEPNILDLIFGPEEPKKPQKAKKAKKKQTSQPQFWF